MKRKPVHGKSILFAKKHGISKLSSIHIWLRNKFGSASMCEFCPGGVGIKSQVYDWALRNECQYDYKRENFIQLCRSCHRKYDDVQGVGKVRVVQCSIKGEEIKQFESIKQAAKSTGISATSIMNNLRNSSNSAGGFVWKYVDQSSPRRKSINGRMITYNGETKSMTEWSFALGGRPALVRFRINILRWSEEKAVSTPVIKNVPA